MNFSWRFEENEKAYSFFVCFFLSVAVASRLALGTWESDNLRAQVLDSQLPHGLDQESVAYS